MSAICQLTQQTEMEMSAADLPGGMNHLCPCLGRIRMEWADLPDHMPRGAALEGKLAVC